MEKINKVVRPPWKQCMKSFFTVLFSQIGTLSMLILYLIMGGFLFNYLEAENEVIICKDKYGKFNSKLNESIKRVIALSTSGESVAKVKSDIDTALTSFASDIFKLQYQPGKNCSTIGQPGNWHEWNIYNSVFFCVTIVTTIGYGNITPKTKWGKLNTIIYSIFGIPLMLMFLTNVGELMARLFRFIYLNICCCRCFLHHKYDKEIVQIELINKDNDMKGNNNNLPPPKLIQEDQNELDEDDNVFVVIPITMIFIVLFAYIVLGAVLFLIWEKDWDLIDGTYFSFITVATIGFGDYVPGKDGFEKKETAIEMIVGGIYCLLGLAILSMCLNLIQDEIVSKFHWLGSKIGAVDEIDFYEKEEKIEIIESRTFSLIHKSNNMSPTFEDYEEPQAIIKQTDC